MLFPRRAGWRTGASVVANIQASSHITFDTELRLVCSNALRDHFADATIAQHFKAYEGKPLTFPAEAAGPKAECLEYHRVSVFDRGKSLCACF